MRSIMTKTRSWILFLVIATSFFPIAGRGGNDPTVPDAQQGTILAAAAGATLAAPVAPTEPNPRFSPSVYKTFAEWKAACDRLPLNRTLKRTLPPRSLLPLKNFAEFEEVLDAFHSLATTGNLARPELWVGKAPAQAEFFNIERAYFSQPAIPFEPFTQKMIVPAGTEVLFHGDLHGDIHSLTTWLAWLNQQGYLEGFRVKRPDVRLVFLGDYTDRGLYGVEVLYTILRFKVENPEQVHLVRGNHEEITLVTNYGFLSEARAKFGAQFNAAKVVRLYDFLPVVLYLGSGADFIQCSHGGMEPGYDPRGLLASEGDLRFQMLGPLHQATFVRTNPNWLPPADPESRAVASRFLRDFQPASPIAPLTLGFMWNDFSVVKGEAELAYDSGRAFVYGEGATRYILNHFSTDTHRLHAVFRAHQHSSVPNPMMRRLKAARGVFRHWQATDSLEMLNVNEVRLLGRIEATEQRPIPSGSVWTFNVSPDSVYGEGCNFNFDSFGILKVAPAFADWSLRVVNLPVVP